MTQTIDKLTPEQEDRLVRFREECLAYGRSTEPSDRKRAEEIWHLFGRECGVPVKGVLWVDGPATACLAAVLLSAGTGPANLGANLWSNLWSNLRANLEANLGANLEANLRANLWSNLEANLGANLEANLEANLRANLWSNLRANLWSNLEANLRANLWSNLEANLRANLWSNLRANLEVNLEVNLEANLGANLWSNLEVNLWSNLRANLWSNLEANLRIAPICVSHHFYGQHGTSWWWHYEYVSSLMTDHSDTRLDLLKAWCDLGRSTGWWLVCGDVIIASERPSVQAVDDRGRLHCLTGPALLCRDGFAIHAVRGVTVPADVIENPESITADRIAGETNAEVRRVMIERYGFDRYLRDGAFVLEQRDDFGSLYRKKMSGEPDMVFVRVVNATAEPDGSYKEYVLPVRSTVRTAHEAVASSFGLSASEYRPSFES